MDTAVKFLVLAAVIATVAFAIIREGINYLEYPSLQVIRYPEEERELIVYHRGIADRRATLFIRELDPRAAPQRIASLNYAEGKASRTGQTGDREPLLGTLSWTSDRTGLVAGARAGRLQTAPELLWIFDVGSRTLYAPGQVRGGQQIGQQHLETILEVKGGLDATIVHWYEMGRKENYVYSWKAHHWNRLANPAPDTPDPPLPRQVAEPALLPSTASDSTLP